MHFSKIISFFLIIITFAGNDFAYAQSVGKGPKGKVLVILSAANLIPLEEGGTHETGIFLGELTEPAEAMLNAGYELIFASPGGIEPTIDQDSFRSIYWGFRSDRLERAKETYSKLVSIGLNSPLHMEELAADESKLSQLNALFVPGGHGPLVDLYYKNMFVKKDLNQDMGKILEFFHRNSKPTGLICHAPAVLATAPTINGKWIYAGYRGLLSVESGRRGIKG